MTAADRNLLFGLFALQNGLIDQVQLVAGFQAWTRDKRRDLADHLLARGDLDDDHRGVVEALVALHIQKHGGTERSLAAIAAGRSTRESLARLGDADVEATLSRVGTATVEPDTDDDRTASYALGTAIGDGQRFRVLRPHARGGLGAVFVALDEELHREVAIKQILEKHADDPTSRARFLLEAEITGGLEHPGIVPVYGLGTYGDGRPYYAMRFVKGDSLKEAVDRFHADGATRGTGFQPVSDPDTARTAVPRADPGRRSLEMRRLLRRFTDVCYAIDYAHSRGVLHRDIKPGNIIVGKHGETLVVDWGLAKAVGRVDPGVDSGERMLVPSSSSGSAETLPGRALGTPSYMSPEQAEGDLERLGPRSDVYSLGATLYYLLTGRPPVEGEIGAVLGAVQRGEFPTPRRRDATIDRALEAVCLKAMAHRTADRHASPKALAEDVERWMADEPVSAWREPISRRARRWARRNRTAVATAAVALLAGRDRALGGAGGADAGQGRHRAGAGSRDAGQPGPGRRQRRPGSLEGGRAGAIRPGGGGDPDVPHGGQRGLPAQGGAVQGAARPAAEVGLGLLRQAGRPARQGDGPGLASGAGTGELRAGGADGDGGSHRGCAGGAPVGPGGASGAGGRAGRRRVGAGRGGPQPGGRRGAPGVDGEAGRGAGGVPRGRGCHDRPGGGVVGGPGDAGGLPVAAGLVPVHRRPARRGTGGVPPGASPTRRRWPRPPGPPPRRGAAWRRPTTGSAPCSAVRAGVGKPRPSSARRWRSCGSWSTRKPRTPTPAVPWPPATSTSATS